ncbi:MAG: S49 family peptidase [Polyangiaceae bacterium]|nr:S49 family peptidase [Polyangiaceae bacterium]
MRRAGALALTLALCACGARADAPPVASSASSGAPVSPASVAPAAGAVVELDLSRGAPEVRAGGLLRNDRVNFVELSLALEGLAASDATTVFVKFGGTRLGWGRSAELARGLAGLRASRRRVICHADDLGNSSYWVAAQGCDRVWLSPAGGLSTTGFSTELVFAKDLLDKVGVSADILQVGKYKGTGETLTRAHASDEVKASLGGVLGDLRARFLEGVQVGRGRHDARVGLEDGPYSAEEALAAGYVDAVGYLDAARADAGITPTTKVSQVFGPSARSASGEGLVGLIRGLTGGKRRRSARGGVVVVLRAEGAISMERAGGLTGGDGIDARTLTAQLTRLGRDDQVKSVVLRVDSPGGSALASDLLWHEIVALRKKKPVVVSVGDMAASGGYYLAVAGTKIVAEETSIVGSIGVVGGKVSLGPALARHGVNVETVTADGAEPRGGYLSPLTPWDDATRARVQATMQGVYDLFLARVAEGRGVTKEVAATFAEGRVFSGREGRARGMVDDWGGLDRAIEIAKREASLDPQAQVRVVAAPGGLLELLGGGGDDPGDEDALSARAVGEARLLRELSPPLAAHAASLWPMVRGERAVLAVPFALLVP